MKIRCASARQPVSEMIDITKQEMHIRQSYEKVEQKEPYTVRGRCSNTEKSPHVEGLRRQQQKPVETTGKEHMMEAKW